MSVTNGSSRSAPTRTVSRCASGCSGWTASTAGSRATTRASSSGGGSVPGPSPMNAQCSAPLATASSSASVSPSMQRSSIAGCSRAKAPTVRTIARPGSGCTRPIASGPESSPRCAATDCRALQHRRQRGARVREQRLARRRQRDRAAVAQEDALAQLGLEPADLLRDRRLRDLQPLGRAREVRLLGDRDEVGELSKFHNESRS